MDNWVDKYEDKHNLLLSELHPPTLTIAVCCNEHCSMLHLILKYDVSLYLVTTWKVWLLGDLIAMLLKSFMHMVEQ